MCEFTCMMSQMCTCTVMCHREYLYVHVRGIICLKFLKVLTRVVTV